MNSNSTNSNSTNTGTDTVAACIDQCLEVCPSTDCSLEYDPSIDNDGSGIRKGVQYTLSDCDPNSATMVTYQTPDTCTPGEALALCKQFGNLYVTEECVSSIPESYNGKPVKGEPCTVGDVAQIFFANDGCNTISTGEKLAYFKVDCARGKVFDSCTKDCINCLGDGVATDKCAPVFKIISDPPPIMRFTCQPTTGTSLANAPLASTTLASTPPAGTSLASESLAAESVVGTSVGTALVASTLVCSVAVGVAVAM